MPETRTGDSDFVDRGARATLPFPKRREDPKRDTQASFLMKCCRFPWWWCCMGVPDRASDSSSRPHLFVGKCWLSGWSTPRSLARTGYRHRTITSGIGYMQRSDYQQLAARNQQQTSREGIAYLHTQCTIHANQNRATGTSAKIDGLSKS